MPVDKTPRHSGARRASTSGGGVSKALIGLIAALIVGALVVAGIWLFGQDDDKGSGGSGDQSSSSSQKSGSAAMAVPEGLDKDPKGVTVGPESGVTELVLFEDFQCPACKALEDMVGEEINQRIDDEKLQVTYHAMTFLDGNLGNDSSARAASAAFCASDEGKYREYHDVVFANQPEKEGDGYTDEDLKSFGKEAGLSGDALKSFEQCVDDKKYVDYANASDAKAHELNVTGTPSIFINGKRHELQSKEDLLKAIDEAGPAKKSEASSK